MGTGREADDLEGAIERAKEDLRLCQADLADHSLLQKADQLLSEIGRIIDRLAKQPNGHST
jgi:hypothetical protein